MSKDGGRLHMTTRPKRVTADKVHQNQIVEWADMPCKVLHTRRWGDWVTLRVQPLRAYEEDRDLRYRADEEITMLGRSFGPA